MHKRLLNVIILTTLYLAAHPQKELNAVKATSVPKIDGILDDAAWQTAPIATGFIQNSPTPGAPASARTEVRILYDNTAVYVGAYLYDDPALIRKQLTARDGEGRQDVDHFSVFFDTYSDQQNGFQFLVTAANVQSDTKLGGSGNPGFGQFGDRSWDAVWQSKVAMKEDGWVVEMRIPYISLRFSKKDVQNWGLQFLRFSRRTNESAFWNAVDPTVSGFVNQFGKYTGLRNIKPPLRLSLSPYVSGGVRFNPKGSRIPTEVLGSGGMDVKYGINESFTLDATLIPDFGQVISDNVINNLTPFEQRFTENRPFFTEGTELFNKSGMFYSRRIGAVPGDYGRVQGIYGQSTQYEIIKNPSVTRLYNAIKFSGRTEKKLGIGVFNAVTAPMVAKLQNLNTKRDTTIQTEPLTNYNIIVLDQAFKGRSSITFTNTNALRNGQAADANVSALDWALYDKKTMYAISGTARYSKTFGYRAYRGAYYLNDDTTTINGRRYLKPYDGFASRLRFAKVGGKIRYNAQVNIESDKYDPNDLGYLAAPNRVYYTGAISYNQFAPTQRFLNYSYTLELRYQYLYKPYSFSSFEATAIGSWLFKNFWDVRFYAGGQPLWSVDFFELQTKGYKIRKPWFYYISADGSTDSRKKLFVNYELGFANAALKNSQYFKTLLGARYRFSNKFTAELQADRQYDKLQIGWAFLRESNRAPIVAYRDYRDITTLLTGTFNFTSKMNLSVRTRHYWSKVRMLDFFNVDANGNHIPRPFIPDQDQNFNLFNVDAFFTWDFRYGSRIIAGWKNFLSNDVTSGIDGLRYNNYSKNLGRTFELPHGNELSLRIIYFLDYNDLRRKR